MHIGFKPSRRPLLVAPGAILAVLTGLLLAAGLTCPAHAQITGTHGSQFAAQPNPALITNLLAEGEALERSGHWGDALAHYEDALREHPQDNILRQRFDHARLHYSLERRLGDRSFRHAARTLSTAQALNLYSSLLSKVNSHYYTTPPWDQLVQRGIRSLEVALADPGFRREHHVQYDRSRFAELRRDLQATTSRTPLRTHREAVNAASAIARLVAYHTQLSESTTLLELTAAAAGGLDN